MKTRRRRLLLIVLIVIGVALLLWALSWLWVAWRAEQSKTGVGSEVLILLGGSAIQSRSDYMRGLKENVIIGKLIPAGTGSPEYQELVPALEGATTVDALAILGADPDALDEDALPEDPAEWLASLGAQMESDEEE